MSYICHLKGSASGWGGINQTPKGHVINHHPM